LFIILIVIGADTGAYFGGSVFKGPKMAPKLSPNKTWSGFISGLIFGTLLGAFVGQFIGLAAPAAFVLSALIVISSVFGDFLESGLKRKFNVKDAGNLMPGHGGLLDRVDSLMMAITFSALVVLLMPNIWPGAL
jgi:phosphatidate cytidylyltransferase